MASIGKGPDGAENSFRLGGSTIVAPTDWYEVKRTEDKLVLRSRDGHQQCTITTLDVGRPVSSLEDFKLICQIRLDAERKALEKGFLRLDPMEPFQVGRAFGMYYSGSAEGRIFCGYLSLLASNLITIYVEGLDVSSEAVGESFRTFVCGLRRLLRLASQFSPRGSASAGDRCLIGRPIHLVPELAQARVPVLPCAFLDFGT